MFLMIKFKVAPNSLYYIYIYIYILRKNNKPVTLGL